MNIAFFLLPKEKVKYLNPESNVRQALEKMVYHRFAAVPLVNDDGEYAGTITEGDLLLTLKEAIDDGDTDRFEKIQIKDVPQHRYNMAVSINAEMQDLLTLASDQNFVPVVDDNNYFIGIIRRRDIIKYSAEKLVE